MSTEITNRSATAPNGRLWFGLAASAGAWFGIGIADMFITWRACLKQEEYGGASSHPGARALYFLFTFALIGVAVLAGTMAFRSLKRLTGLTDLLRAEGHELKEFMAIAGVFVSFTLGMGMVWLCIPLFIIQMCLRSR